MKTTTIAVVLLLASSSLFAQESAIDRVDPPSQAGYCLTTDYSTGKYKWIPCPKRADLVGETIVAAEAGYYRKPLKPVVPRFDWKFLALSGAAAAFTIADDVQTSGCLARGHCLETNPLFGSHPSNARLYGTSLAINVGATFAAYELRRHGPRPLRMFWTAPLIYQITTHATAMYQSHENFRRK